MTSVKLTATIKDSKIKSLISVSTISSKTILKAIEEALMNRK